MFSKLKLCLSGLGILGFGGIIAGNALATKNSSSKTLNSDSHSENSDSLQALTQEERLELQKDWKKDKQDYENMCSNWGISHRPKPLYVADACNKTKALWVTE